MSGETWHIEWREGGAAHRAALSKQLAIGRSRTADVVLQDPYVSRRHCVVGLSDGRAFVDARSALNRVVVDDSEVEVAVLESGASFMVGQTVFYVWEAEDSEDVTTRRLPRTPTALFVLRRSTRELVDHEATLIARFSPSEFAAFAALAAAYPDSAAYAALGGNVWDTIGFDLYQLHRLLQRVRQRLGTSGNLLENVRGIGYRLTAPVRIA